MLIQGGVSELGKTMDSPWILDLWTFRWKEAKLLDKIDPGSVKRGFKHTQLFKINDDLTNGEPIDNHRIKYMGPGHVSHHACCVVLYERPNQKIHKLVSFYEESDKKKKVPSS